MPGTKIPDWINEIGMIGIGGFKIIALTLGIKFNTVMCYRNSPADCLSLNPYQTLHINFFKK